MTIWHFPDEAGIKTGDLFLLFKSKNSSKASWKFCQQELPRNGQWEEQRNHASWERQPEGANLKKEPVPPVKTRRLLNVVSQTLHTAEDLKGLLRYFAELVPVLMSLKEELVINKILWCWNMTVPVNLPPASTCLCGSVHKAHGMISHRWSWCIRLNLNMASSLLFFAEGKGCVLILGTPWLLSAGVTVGMLFQSNFFYLKVFMWADKALSLYPKVPCSTLVLLITLTCAGAATLDRKSVLSPILCLIFHGG